jgi:TolA-binding protein
MSIKETKSAAILKAFIKKYPDSVYALFAKGRLEEMKGSAATSAPKAKSKPKHSQAGKRNLQPAGADRDIWATIKDSRDAGDFEIFLTQFPNSVYAPYARAKYKRYLTSRRDGLERKKANEALERQRKKTEAQEKLDQLRRSVEELEGRLNRAREAEQGFSSSSGDSLPKRVKRPARKSSSTSCHDLWVRRNQIYKNKGYCFKTSKGKRYFGNAGCWTSNPRLSRSEKNRVNSILRQERRNGCR